MSTPGGLRMEPEEEVGVYWVPPAGHTQGDGALDWSWPWSRDKETL